MGKPEQSLSCYEKSLEWVHIGRKYCEAGALAGIAQVQHQYGSLTLESSELRRAEIIAAEYEYNDYLAAMRLLQGRLALQALDGDEAALKLQQSAIYALRFNRFLLDEVITDIINVCGRYGSLGRNVLETLKTLWRSGSNAAVEIRPDTISFVVGDVSLVEAERAARSRESGDTRPRTMVLERLDRAPKTG